MKLVAGKTPRSSVCWYKRASNHLVTFRKGFCHLFSWTRPWHELLCQNMTELLVGRLGLCCKFKFVLNMVLPELHSLQGYFKYPKSGSKCIERRLEMCSSSISSYICHRWYEEASSLVPGAWSALDCNLDTWRSWVPLPRRNFSFLPHSF